MSVAAIALSLAGALCYGVASALQHRAAISELPEAAMSPRLVLRLFARPGWILGNLLDVAGFVMQFLALQRGPLTLVEPILVLSLVCTVPAGAIVNRHRVSMPTLAWSVVVSGGLALFLAVANPGLGRDAAPGRDWIVLGAILAVVIVAMLVLVRGARTGRRPAVLLGVGAGCTFGYTAVLTSVTGRTLSGGVVHTLTSWPPYGLAVSGILAVLMMQSAFSAGALRFSLPALTVLQPVVAILIGRVVLGEAIASHGLAPFWEAVGVGLSVLGIVALAGVEAGAREAGVRAGGEGAAP